MSKIRKKDMGVKGVRQKEESERKEWKEGWEILGKYKVEKNESGGKKIREEPREIEKGKNRDENQQNLN